MTYEVATVACGGPGLKFHGEPDQYSAGNTPVTVFDNHKNQFTPCQAYQKLLDGTKAEILILFHDDVTVHDPKWLTRILSLFENPNCVAAGMGGALALGNTDLYRKPYDIWNMARRGYASNQTDAETHGERFTGDRQVAVLDAFCMAVRVQWLREHGGWPVEHLSHHCADLWLACEAARAGMEIWMAGVSVSHWGGGTSTKPAYEQAKWLQGGSLASDHQSPHRFLWREYSDVLPVEVRL